MGDKEGSFNRIKIFNRKKESRKRNMSRKYWLKGNVNTSICVEGILGNSREIKIPLLMEI